jgi:hypothetical protein
MGSASTLSDPGLRIGMISKEFLGVPYEGFTLVGSREVPERLVIGLDGVDCFTFIDYVEAMRLSRSMADFRDALIRVRYREGRVAFEGRKHFFTDWVQPPDGLVRDITREIGGAACVSAVKKLNLKEDGSLFLPGIMVREREVRYIPAESVDSSLEERLKTGDYVGIYTHVPGLDVSHVGIFAREGNAAFLRHASSSEGLRRVVDQEFGTYIAAKPGIVVMRPYGEPISGR